MIRIEPKDWLPSSFARAIALTDILRHPTEGYLTLNAEQKNALRQSQIEAAEVVRLLGYHESQALIRKADQVTGWVPNSAVILDESISAFEPITSLKLSADAFFQIWKDTPYVWGGVTQSGIDCSGLTQRYYLDVLDRRLPKNSYDQRKAGKGKVLADVAAHDLVFCTRIGGRGIHHVGIYVDKTIWHAHGELGVICQPVDEFLALYQVLEVVAY